MTMTLAGNNSYKLCLPIGHSRSIYYDRSSKLDLAVL